ncbi:MAG TPA: hypothetical protein VL325_09600 [Pyrinomonadaceae bacterium]|jgi:hypothetical protein|nr:hypothetical protein [Pyrinomonadaceae bacterium]
MERFLQILAVILLGVAAFFFWRGDGDWLFACVVLGICAFFLSMRFRIKGRMQQREAEQAPAELVEPLPNSDVKEIKDSQISK